MLNVHKKNESEHKYAKSWICKYAYLDVSVMSILKWDKGNKMNQGKVRHFTKT